MVTALENHCLSISHSGNGPAVAAVLYKDNVENFLRSMEKFEGKLILAKVNNTKATVE
jgi:shikimate kinase